MSEELNKDALGHVVTVGDVIFTTRGSYQSISNSFAIVTKPETAGIRVVQFQQDRVYDEPGFDYNGTPNDKYGYYGKDKGQRAHHYENERYELRGRSNLQLKFSRCVTINPNDIEGNDLLKNFLIAEQEKARV